jgi:hypothetical protein
MSEKTRDATEDIAFEAYLQHPLPWRIERDWTWEVLDAEGKRVASCQTPERAEAVVAWGKKTEEECQQTLKEFDIDD